MVLTGIQPPENIRQAASSRGISKSIPIPLGGRGAVASHCAIVGPGTTHPQLQNSAFSLSGLYNIDSPQRSAGSFNMVHPMRKALMPTGLMGNQTSSSLTKMHQDENDILLLCAKSPVDGGTPSSSSSTSLLPSYFNDNSWEDQPLHAYPTLITYANHLQSSELLMKPNKMVVASVASSASGSNVTRIGSAESISTASSGRLYNAQSHFSLGPETQLFGKQLVNKETTPSQREEIPGSTESLYVFPNNQTPFLEYNERMICAEEEYGTLACCLQGDFWAQYPEETLCDCEALFKQQEHSMQIDDMIFDIPITSSLSSATDMKITQSQVIDKATNYHSECIMSSFRSSLDLIRDGEEDCGLQMNPSLAQAFRSHFAPYDSSTIQGDQLFNQANGGLMQGLVNIKSSAVSAHPSTRSSDCNIHKDRPCLVRSCSLTTMPPTSSTREEEQNPSLLRTSSLRSNIGLVQSRKRSFSASELSSDYDQPELLMEFTNEHGNSLKLQSQHTALLKQQAMNLQHKDNKMGNKLGGLHDELLVAKNESNILGTTEEAINRKDCNILHGINIDDGILPNQLLICKEGMDSNMTAPGINNGLKNNQTSCKQVVNKSNLQQINLVKQVRRRHGTATDPQSMAARTRREKFSERIRMLQSLVPNGERLDTVSMLAQTLEYIRFLQHRVWELYHGSSISTATNTCDKWKHFMQDQTPQSSNTTSSTTSS